MNNVNFEQARDQIRAHLPSYLARFGIDSRKPFKCINPAHPDRHPSATIKQNPELGYCFSCGSTYDIFDAAHYLENKPLAGRGFITENLMYLANMFGVALPEMNLSDEELKDMEARRAYAQAARIVQTARRGDLVSEKLAAYKWGEEVIGRLSIGTVESYESYIDKMLKHGHSIEFLMEIDLAGQDEKTHRHRKHPIFQPENIIYPIKDELGNCIAFTARNLKFEYQKAEIAQNTKAIEADEKLSEKQKQDMLEKLWKPRKYINTKATFLYNKSKVLYNFNEARKHSSHSVLLFEGNPDCVTAFAAGAQTAAALCGTAFTKDHLEMILKYGVKKITMVFDPDLAGEKAKKRFSEVFENFGGRPGLDVEIISMHEGTGDPDQFIRAHGDLSKGLLEFRKFPRTDLFSWKIQQTIDEGSDPNQVCIDTIPLVVNEPHNIRRLQMADRLAEATGLSKDFVRREVLRQIDSNESKISEERQIITQELSKSLAKNPANVQSLVSSAHARLELLNTKKTGYDPLLILEHADKALEHMESVKDMFELVTGYPIFDSLMGGIPRVGPMISVPGKPHHGKALTLDSYVKTPNSWITMGDVKVGDELASIDGKSSIVTGVFPQGVEKIYKVTFSDGRSVEASGGHLWQVKFLHKWTEKQTGSAAHNDWQIFTTDALRTFCLNGNKKNGHNTVYIPTIDGVGGQKLDLPIDPWLLGALLGDGGLKFDTIGFTSVDSHIVEKVRSTVERIGVSLNRTSGKYGYIFTYNGQRGNPLKLALEKLGLTGTGSSTKFIPVSYLEADQDSRQQLLQGLLDTDGFASKEGQIDYVTTSLRLANDVQYLVRSLGGLCRMTTKMPKCMHKGRMRKGKQAYTLFIRLKDRENAFTLPRKVGRVDKRIQMPRLTITAIEEAGFKETQCITVSHPSKLFITNDFIVTHNSIWIDNLIHGLLKNNKNAMVFLHHVDDAMILRLPRIMGVMSGLPSREIQKVGAYISDPGSEFETLYRQTKEQLRDWIMDERLIMADQSLLSTSLADHEGWIRSIRDKHPSRDLIVIGDNFHLFDIPEMDAGEAKTRSMSKMIANFPTRYGLTTIFSMEIPKDSLRPGVRPTYTNLKNSGGISFDSKVNMNVYQELQDLEEPLLTWRSPKYLEHVIDEHNCEHMVEQELPIVEIGIDKNKVTGLKRDIFYRLEPNSGRMEECTEMEQLTLRSLKDESKKKGTKNSYAQKSNI